ncbi:MATE family efflux transporter [Rothia sp. HMSC065B04]|uniref:MATE family efflux transporter n=1 Tax=Rothia sp. HMSC065B04 TaxID=1739349 RepID=UPI0008A45BE6|nr:MATE family efflux transporter [Rothia sp. HMSC065B04]OFJ75609.1 MATE family efflux transporter [Rothia sp. HMSC065B04]
MTSHQTENNAPKNGAPNNTAPAAGHGPHGASEDPQNIYLLKEAPILKALLSLGVPMALGLAITSIYNVVNSYFVGHYGGTEDLAATSYGVPVFGVIMAIAGLFGLGSSTLASRKLGEGQPAHEIHRVTSFALYSALGAGIVAAAIGFILADPITSIMGASGGSYEPTRIYMHLMFLGAPLAIGMFTLEQLVRSEGYAKQSMYGIIVGTVVTCIFDVLFIAIMGMGVAGAGWAMLLANGASMLYYLLFLMRQSENFSANIRDFSLDPAIIKPVVAVGAAELIQSLNLIFAALLLNNLAASYGDDTVAAFGLAMRLNMVPEMLCMGLCMGGIPLYAYAYGARNGARVKEALRTATILSVATSAIITIPVLIFRRELLAVVGDASLIDTGEEIMVALMLAAVFNAVSIVFVSWFQAAGKGGPAMLMTLGIALLFFPAVYFGNMWFGFKGLTWAFPFTQVLACALGLVLFLATGGAKVPPAEAEVEAEGSEDSDVQAAQVSGAQPEQKA